MPTTGQGRLHRDSRRIKQKLALVGYVCVLMIVPVLIGRPPYEFAVCAVPVAVFVAALFAVPRSGIRADEGGVTIRSPFGMSRRVPWSDVSKFQVMRGWPMRGKVEYGVYVIRTAGKPLTTSSCARYVAAGKDSPEEITRMAEDLEAERMRLASVHGEPGQPADSTDHMT